MKHSHFLMLVKSLCKNHTASHNLKAHLSLLHTEHLLLLLLTKTWLHQTLSFDADYLLVLFIAELFSSAALLLRWWYAQASERLPRAPWLTLLLLSVHCVFVPRTARAGAGWRAARCEPCPPTSQQLDWTARQNSAHQNTVCVSWLSLALCYLTISIKHMLPPPATTQNH